MEEELFLKKLGERINSLRIEQNKSQTSLAEEVEVDRTTIHRILKGEINFSIKIIRKIAIALNIELWQLMKFQD